MVMPYLPYYLYDLHGSIRFTEKGRNELGRYFDMAGVNINEIKTVEDYLFMRKTAAPHFINWLEDRADQWPDTEQFRLLRAATFGTKSEIEGAIENFEKNK